MTHHEKIARWIGARKIGVEIGAGSSPLPGLNPPPIYVDCFKTFGASPSRADFYGHACHLPFNDNSLDYVLSSHVLEHVANPVAALVEWQRVLRPGGIIYFVVPDRRATWEHQRELTTVEHMLADFQRGTTACDATHIDEFVFQADWSRYSPKTPVQDVATKQAELARGMHEAVARGEDINIHFHTFEPSNVRELLETLTSSSTTETGRAGPLGTPGLRPPDAENGGLSGPALPPLPRLKWEILEVVEHFPAASPNGVLAILRVHKSWRAHADADALRIRSGGDPRAILRADAQPFEEWAAKTAGLGEVR